MNDIRWNRISLAEFRTLACLTEDEIDVLEDWARGIDIRATADKLHVSTRKVDALRESIRKKYDEVSIYTPLLPKRKA